jgi:hypothetical protein
MTNITVELSDTEYKAMQFIAFSPQDWVDNVVRNRARKAIDSICEIVIEHCNENGIAIAVGKEAQVAQAYELDLVDNLADVDVTLPSAP